MSVCFQINFVQKYVFLRKGEKKRILGIISEKFFNLRGPWESIPPRHTHGMYFLLTLWDVTRKCTKNKEGKNSHDMINDFWGKFSEVAGGAIPGETFTSIPNMYNVCSGFHLHFTLIFHYFLRSLLYVGIVQNKCCYLCSLGTFFLEWKKKMKGLRAL